MPEHWEPLGPTLRIAVSDEHRFGTDAFLLTAFSQYKQKDLACDLGTGCGIIPLLMYRSRPPQALYALDIQPEAIRLLEKTKEGNALSSLTPVCADLKTLWEGAPLGTLSLVTCNPPYKAANAGIESAQEAHRIARHEVACNSLDVCRAAAKLLRFGGRLCLCNRPERLCDVMNAMRQAGLEPKRLRFVAKNPQSAPWLFLIEGRKGGKSFLQVEPTLFSHNGAQPSEKFTKLYQQGLEPCTHE